MSGRNTRARSRATGTSSTPNTARQKFYSEPPPADLPGLYPVHDGSYGVNTHINLDSAKRGRGRKAKPGFVNEDDEDKRFTRRMNSKDGKRYTMENDLKRIVGETVEEAEKDNGVDEGTNVEGYALGSNMALVDDSYQPNTQPSVQHSAQHGSQTQRVDDYKGPGVTKLGRMFTAKGNDNQKPPYAPIQYRSPDPEILIHNAHPSAPSPSEGSFYGVPTGRGAPFPSSTPFVAPARAPIRLDSSRSFTTENALYSDASLTTPSSRDDQAPALGLSVNETEPIYYGGGSYMAQDIGYTDPSGNNPATIYPPANNNGPTPSGPQETTNEPHLTSAQWQRVTNLIRDMRTSPRQLHFDVASTPDYMLDHLTPREIRAVRALIQDMGNDETTTAKIMAEFDRVTERAEHGQQAKALRKEPAVDTIPDEDAFNAANNDNIINTDGNVNNGQMSDSFPTVPVAEDMNPLGNVPDNFAGYQDVADDERVNRRRNQPFNNDDSSSDSGREFFPPSKKNPDRPKKRRTDRGRNRRSLLDWAALGGPNAWASTAFVFLTILFWAWLLLTLIGGASTSPRDDVFSDAGAQWPSWDSMKSNIGKIIPSTISGDVITIDLDSGDTQTKLVNNITPKIPDQVFVEKDVNGKFKISQDFWHALRDLIREDDIILTLENVKKAAPEISNAHWLAIKSRLSKDGFGLQTGSNTSSGEHAAPVDKASFLRSWDHWVSQNQEELKRMVGGVAVSREEFIKLFRGEIKSYQQEIRKELVAQDSRIKELVDTVTKLRNSAKNTHGGLTEKEVKIICDGAIRKAIENAKLDALASGRIRGHANDMLINQVNFFGMGAGAVIDPYSSSSIWEPPSDHLKLKSKKWYLRDGYRPQPQSSAVTFWSEEGECFCAGKIVRGVPQIANAIGVLTSRIVIPQHLVVEHILPSSTLDPGAMPKDIEVWAYIEEVTLRDEVRAFSSSHMPIPLAAEATTGPEGFVKIGHFTYENRDYGDGTQIFKMSSELMRMRAATSHIIVKAVTNYGADHTCFYRLRLYGEVVEGKSHEVTR
ncbi:putative spindle pole body-associated protein sad1 protein [Daldinia childiae]|uniref:putative spindle pole body-associated protein sad1 protein n=1 Tax=Daldinia childiae TaxID=326645 RepID=UPI001448798E|nr:putative spindle pole body-associated protein sad1 protein [Daldinia childiae]KAF3061554.1 putative spindle pole body-associated protein sad1 protein [Daldinia childiae]